MKIHLEVDIPDEALDNEDDAFRIGLQERMAHLFGSIVESTQQMWEMVPAEPDKHELQEQHVKIRIVSREADHDLPEWYPNDSWADDEFPVSVAARSDWWDVGWVPVVKLGIGTNEEFYDTIV